MRFQQARVVSLVACIIGSLALAMAARAQTPDADAPGVAGKRPDIRVDVTGSNIKRVEDEGALPITVITRPQIERSGATTPMELLRLVSANSSLNAVSLANTIGTTTFSVQTASLRGLGGSHTLVLINGHRIEGFPGETAGVQGVTLSSIPFSAIERVEILKDGASAIYGSDAIAGVINFITRAPTTRAPKSPASTACRRAAAGASSTRATQPRASATSRAIATTSSSRANTTSSDRSTMRAAASRTRRIDPISD